MSKTVCCTGNPVLYVDLTKHEITTQILGEDIRRKFIGGRGVNDWLLYSMVTPGVTDPLSPENVIVFGTGLIEGCKGKTLVPGALRLTVSSLNALSGGYGETSSAGFFSTDLKRAGYDHIVISGKSIDPVYLWIDNEHVELRDAQHLIGKSTFETDRAIKDELSDEQTRTCTIGPAGENLVRYALMNVTNRYCGRCGIGAVMGAKKLKAIAVRGAGSVELFNSDQVAKISQKVRNLLKADPGARWIAEHGMAGTPEIFDKGGIQGTKNFQEVCFDRIGELGYDAIKKYYKRTLPCFNCPVRCDRLVEIPEGEPYGGTFVSSLQASPAYNFAHFLIDDINTMIKGFELCNGLGMDIHSFSCVAQWAIECYERGILTKENTDRLDLRWGDGPLILELIRRVALREGKLGNLLADGVYAASMRLGRDSEKYAMQMKKMEIDDEIRTCIGWCLGIITDPRGPTHTLGAPTAEMRDYAAEQAKEIFGSEKAGDGRSYEAKPELVVETERARILQDCLGLCYFATHVSKSLISKKYNMETYAELVKAAAGWDISSTGLVRVAERILAVEKCINVMAGLGRKDDFPPDRFYEPIPSGPFEGVSLDEERVIDMIREHDRLHGWDVETGIPSRRTLEHLELGEVADTLWPPTQGA